MAGAAGWLTLTIKKSSVVQDDVQDDGIRAVAVMPLPMSARVMAGWQGQGNFSRTMRWEIFLCGEIQALVAMMRYQSRPCVNKHLNSLHRPCMQHSSEEDMMMLMLLQNVVVDDL